MLLRYTNMFRAKGASDDRWYYGDLIRGTHISHPMGATTIKPETVGMYTGLTDKNGKKIFEGDIVTYERCLKEHLPTVDIICYGVWNCTCCHGVYGWACQNEDIDLRGDARLVVIGNIHDNPELISGKQVTT